MTQIVVTLEDNGNPSLIKSAIAMIRGVRQVFVKNSEDSVEDSVVTNRLKAFDALKGVVSLSDLDLSDERIRYILRE